ncbi:hypothetical protein TUBRATIS_27320 [Tubulinosema ratisbonensis]|uniref:Uncharacterized protein n=1 Tax=Tubulinosema ratisbonensis TaxID=291195 RepID=A0A437AI78_9MICR|nr:hypothetical protein TUBRATIS_27320 [Tubulinosema ratisbonensis]
MFTGRYLKFNGNGAVITATDTISDAAQWEAVQVGDNPTILAIQKQGTESALDNLGGLGMLMATSFKKKKTQTFKLNLNQDSNFNIVQDDRLYLFYDISASSFKLARNVPGHMKGFRFATDDGSRLWPDHVVTQHKWL